MLFTWAGQTNLTIEDDLKQEPMVLYSVKISVKNMQNFSSAVLLTAIMYQYPFKFGCVYRLSSLRGPVDQFIWI